MKNLTILFIFLALILQSIAQPTAITWQGKLLDASGNAITQSNVAMTFAMFDASTGGNQLWPSSGIVTKSVDVVQGLYSVQLGTGVGDDIPFTAAIFNGKTPWLEVKVGTETLPRSEITNVPFALISNELSVAGWASPGAIGTVTPASGTFAALKLPMDAGTGKVLTSDADGNATWQTGLQGTDPGQMQYWNGTAWVTVEAGTYGQVLEFRNGTPVWVDKNINTLSIGDTYQGGIIAYFLQAGDPGYDANIRHGLIAAPSDQSPYAPWGCSGTIISASGTALGTGAQNTLAIVEGCSEDGIAAKLCSNLVLNGYSDWFLPSKDELNKLYLKRVAIGGFADAKYWSSSEISGDDASDYAWLHAFSNGLQFLNYKSNNFYVRAVRAF